MTLFSLHRCSISSNCVHSINEGAFSVLRSAWSVSQVCILPVYSLHTVCIMSEAWVLQANPKNKVADPIPGMIVAINKYLQAYHMYRAEGRRP